MQASEVDCFNDIRLQLDRRLYDLKEEMIVVDSKKKVWQHFWRLINSKTGEIVKNKISPRGYAVCRGCNCILKLGTRGGTGDLDNHLKLNTRCKKSNNETRSSPSEDKNAKNQSERRRKQEISNSIKDIAAIFTNDDNATHDFVTLLRIVIACLSVIPRSLLQFFTDGKNPEDRPIEFYTELQREVQELLELISRAKDQASQPINHLKEVDTIISQSQKEAPIQLRLGLSCPRDEKDNIEILWVPNHIETVLSFDRNNTLGRHLADLVHPEDYQTIFGCLLQNKSSDYFKQLETSFSFSVRLMKKPSTGEISTYQKVFLTGFIRHSIRTPRQMTNNDVQSLANGENPSASRLPRSDLSIKITTYCEYETWHLMDGTIIWADERLSCITGYLFEDVNHKSAHEFIRKDAIAIVRDVHDSWIQRLGNGGYSTNSVSFPLHCKGGKVVYIKSYGKHIKRLNPTTNEITDTIVLNNTLIHEEEFYAEMSIIHLKEKGSNYLDQSNSFSISTQVDDICSTAQTTIEVQYNSPTSSTDYYEFESLLHNTTDNSVLETSWVAHESDSFISSISLEDSEIETVHGYHSGELIYH